MMTEAKILLPVRDNAGESIIHVAHEVIARIMQTFGGATICRATGLWRSPEGKVYEDELLQVTIAGDWDQENAEALTTIAEDAAYDMMQECIYLAMPWGVQFVAPSHHQIAA